MYGKVFSSMYDGTLVEDWRSLVTFQQMIVLCDADGVLDMTHFALAQRTGIPLDIIESGIEKLEQIDANSRTNDQDGKRIVRLDNHRNWGWSIVNHNKYKNLHDNNEVRQQNKERKRKQRDKENSMSQNVTAGHAMSRHTDTDTNTDIKTLAQECSNSFLIFWNNYPKKKSKAIAEKAWLKIKPNESLVKLIFEKLEIAKAQDDWIKDSGKFIPYPATWLNAKGWEDEFHSDPGDDYFDGGV